MATRKRWIRQLGKQIDALSAAQRKARKTAGEHELHQLRIRLRSLRIQLVPVAGHAGLRNARQALSAVSAASNALRDRDVMLGIVKVWPEPYASEASQLINGRPLDTRNARSALTPPGWDAQIAALPALLRQHVPSRGQLQRKMRNTARHYRRKARSELRALAPQCSPDLWHEARITLKKVRYLHDELRDWLPRRWHALGKDARPAQDALGHLHDLDVLHQQFGASFSAALNQFWQLQRAAALADAERATSRVLRALGSNATRGGAA